MTTRQRHALLGVATSMCALVAQRLHAREGPTSLPTLDEPSPYRDAMMPKRKQTREQNRRDRINQERRQRTELIAEEQRQRQAWLAANYEPPPF